MDKKLVEELRPNLFRVKVPLPGSPLGYLNSYVLTSADRNLVIDTGFDCQECLYTMISALNRLGVDLGRTDFFMTHLHVDHIGLLPRLLGAANTVYVTKIDSEIQYYMKSRQGRLQSAIRNGFPEQELFAEYSDENSYNLAWTANCRNLSEGFVIRIGDYAFRCLATPGHTRGHTCLFDESKHILLSGDHLLKGITPIIQSWMNESNPLKSYLSSLERTRRLDVDLVLPGHGEPFEKCAERIAEINQHHVERLEEIRSLVSRKPKSAFEIALQMKWNIPGAWRQYSMEQKWFATGEALAHLIYLEMVKSLQRQVKGDRIFFYRH